MALAICIGIGDKLPSKKTRPYRVLNVHWNDGFDIEWASDVSRRRS
jgi:hypothetical protein